MANNNYDNFGRDPFEGGFGDIFNSMLNDINRVDGQSARTSGTRYLVNGKEVSPEDFQQIQNQRTTGTEQLSQGKSGRLKQGGILDTLGTDLTKQAKDGKLDPVIGRDKEIQETAEVLSRRGKNNPILVGEAGVGKTAVVRGLAQAIVKGNVPASLKGKRLIEIDISSLDAGTQYRGSFEEKIQNLITEVKKAKNVILFFDEIHQILNSGSTGENGSKGLSDILKPALTRGDFSIIGSTTENEYHTTIEKDAALARRFNPIKVLPPTKDQTFLILKGIRELYEKHHNVKLPDSVLREAVELSDRYMPNRSLPDKAIDLVDMTAAHLSAQHPVIEQSKLEEEKKALTQQKEESVKKEDYEQAKQLTDKIKAVSDKLKKSSKTDETVATTNDVADSIQRMTGIPASKITMSDITRLSTLNKRLKEEVIGQDEAIDNVTDAIIRNRTGFGHPDRPTSFLFAGKTGTGKTLLAKNLAREVFGSEKSMIRLDMSEYSDQASLTKLIGVSAGYVGYGEDSNALTEQVNRNPYSIILLDEIEKAHPQVLTALLQVLDDGRLTEGNGQLVDFKNTIIIATSNAGFGVVDHKPDESIADILKPYFKPEFLNRFDAVVRFNDLAGSAVKKIVAHNLDSTKESFAQKGIVLAYTPEVVDYLTVHGTTKDFGARPLRRLIDREINGQTATAFLKNTKLTAISFSIKNGKLVSKAN